MYKSRISAVASAAAILLAASSALAGPPVPVSECGTVINEPGKYRVTRDLYCGPEQQGIRVLASDVTVDLKGHTITCNASGNELVGAVLVGNFGDPTLNVNNVRVKNGTVSGCDDGVIFFFAQSGKITKMSLASNVDAGITLLWSRDTIVKNNNAIGNITGIRSFSGVNNQIKGNSVRGNFDTGILVDGETNSIIACNTSERDAFGIGLGPLSSGNEVRGNLINNAAWYGLVLYGLGPPDNIFAPGPSGNLIRTNVVQGSGVSDLSEAVFNTDTWEFFVPDGAQCQNTWMKNQFVTQQGPVDCIGAPVVLDEVCAVNEAGKDKKDKK